MTGGSRMLARKLGGVIFFWRRIVKMTLQLRRFGKLILRKVIKIAGIRSHILKLKCTKFDFGWGSRRPRWGAYSAPQTP